jgi:hypothetical protein
MAKKFDNLSKNNKNINALSSIFSNDEPEESRVEATPSVVTPKTSITQVTSVIQVTPKAKEAAFVRQTLIVASEDLDYLRNLVYTRRMEGKVTYTQKEALQEVMQYFKQHHQDIKERPEDMREAEQRRSESISKGKN